MKVEIRALANIKRPFTVPSLPENTVHIWHGGIVKRDLDLQTLYRFLSVDERVRAKNFHFDKHRNQFISSRGMLRVLLAAYLGNSPERIVLSYSKYGKPLLSMGLKSSDLNFNISHAEGIAVFSFAKNIQVGIDIERAQQDRNCLEISEHFFSDYEREYLRFLSDKPLNEAFIRCWTRKEAFVKAKGEGLSMPFHQFDVSLGEDEPASLLATRPDPEEALRWTLNDLAIETGYVAAVACERANCVEGEPVIVENRSQVVSKAPMIFSIGI